MHRPALIAASLLATSAIGQIDQGYTQKIKEYTTEPFFLTELVDNLPASNKVPTPEKFLGHIIGAPNVLDTSEQAAAYLRALEKASDRIKVLRLGMSEEGREMVVAVISDSGNLRQLDRLKKQAALLSDPRKFQQSEGRIPGTTVNLRMSKPYPTDEQIDEVIHEALPMYWATGGMHAPETGPPEMLMELAYRLIVSNDPKIQTIRKNEIVMLTPVLDVDGRDRVVDLYKYKKANPKKREIPLVYWGKYVAHDDNRDAMTMALNLSKSLMATWLDFHPTVLHDLHESEPFLYISTGTGPYNAWLDPIVISEWQEMAYNEIQQMSAWGVPGVWTHDYYDGWSPGYGFYVANGHNAIGRFYEIFSGGGADTGVRTINGETSREWYRPNPAFPKVRWSIRDNVNMAQSALLLGMYNVAVEKEKFLRNLYLKSKRSIAKATTEGPAAWVLPADDKRKGAQANLLGILKMQGCEVERLTKDATTTEGKFPVGSYVVRMDQTYSREADMLLDTQYYRASDPRSYDDTGWCLPLLFNVRAVRVKDASILKVDMLPTTEFNNKSTDPSDVGSLDKTKLPRIALVHTWQNTQDEGWARIAFDQLGVPYKYVSVHELRDTPDLKSKYDVILFPQTGGSAQSIVSGLPKVGDPIPWKPTPEYPSLGGPDTSDDIRGGIELEGIVNVKKFVEAGGLFICVGNTSRIPIDYGIVNGVSVTNPTQLNAPGGVYRVEKGNADSPILAGFGANMGAYFNGNSLPLLTVGGGGGRGGRGGGRGAGAAAGGAQANRPSGRGSLTDPDVIQARPPYTPKEQPGDTPERDPSRNPTLPRPRVLLRFSALDSLMMSGMLDHGEELAGKAAVVQCSVGKGNVLLFAINPFWRGQTVGSYPLVLNAAINWNKLAAPPTPPADPIAGGDQ